jgi:hypothetical protein
VVKIRGKNWEGELIEGLGKNGRKIREGDLKEYEGDCRDWSG